MIAADTIASVVAAVLTERKLYIVRPEHPTMGAIALEAYGFGKACDAVALQGNDLAALLADIGARCAEALAARATTTCTADTITDADLRHLVRDLERDADAVRFALLRIDSPQGHKDMARAVEIVNVRKAVTP